jgi:hypothetical protein
MAKKPTEMTDQEKVAATAPSKSQRKREKIQLEKTEFEGGGKTEAKIEDPKENLSVSIESEAVANAAPVIIEYRFQRARGVSAYRLLRKIGVEGAQWFQIGGMYPDYQGMRMAYEVDRLTMKSNLEWEDQTLKRIIRG